MLTRNYYVLSIAYTVESFLFVWASVLRLSKILPFFGNVISWVNVLPRCNVRRFTTLLYVLGDLELVGKGNPQKSKTNNDDSTVHSLLITKVKICNHMLYRHVTILKHLSLFSFSQVLRVSHRCKEGRPSRSGIYSAHVCGSESGPRQDYLFSFHLCNR